MSQKTDFRWLPRRIHQVKKYRILVLYCLKFSLKSKLFIAKFNYISFLQINILCVSNIQKTLQKSDIINFLFEPCSSCVDIISFCFVRGKKRENTKNTKTNTETNTPNMVNENSYPGDRSFLGHA